MTDYVLTSRAEKDLTDIFVFGYQSFGVRQAKAYAASLERTFELLCSHPELGRPADKVRSGLRRHEHGSHIIFYDRHEAQIRILALLHRSQLPWLLSSPDSRSAI